MTNPFTALPLGSLAADDASDPWGQGVITPDPLAIAAACLPTLTPADQWAPNTPLEGPAS